METLLTRSGEGCRIVVIGDLGQDDAAAFHGGPGGGEGGDRGGGKWGGLHDLVMRLRGGGGGAAGAAAAATVRRSMALVELDEGDVQRSGVVRDVLALYRVGPGRPALRR
jgi:hypothetical protein